VFVLILMEETELPERPLMLTMVTWTVALSAYAHGLTAWPGANRYGDWYAAQATDHAAMPESAPVAEQRLRASAPPARIGTSIVRSDSLSDAVIVAGGIGDRATCFKWCCPDAVAERFSRSKVVAARAG
jgi:hypothetical protein